MKLLRNCITRSLLVSCLIVGSAAYAAQMDENNNAHAIFLPKQIKWNKGPDSLPKGAEIAVLEGDPSKSEPFTMRIKFPANYRIPPHYHPIIEHITVITGNFYLGLGDTFDKKQAKLLPTGSFGYMAPETHHYAFTEGSAIVQLHGVGPWGITYVNPQDDPRNKQ